MQNKVEHIFRKHGGQLRMSDALRLGVSRYALYSLRDKGTLEEISRGFYRLAEFPIIGNPDLVAVGLRYPKAVICLISALSYHELTTQIPHFVYVAIPKKTRDPSMENPMLNASHFSEASYNLGIEKYFIDGVQVKIYDPEKTLVDCAKFRNKIGQDILFEALKFYRSRRAIKINKILEYAKICRVENVIRPYLEVLL